MFECHKKDKAVNDGRHSEALSVLIVSVELVSNKKKMQTTRSLLRVLMNNKIILWL